MSTNRPATSTIGRKRRTLGWFLLTLGLLTGVMYASPLWFFTYTTEHRSVTVFNRTLTLWWHDRSRPATGLNIESLAHYSKRATVGNAFVDSMPTTVTDRDWRWWVFNYASEKSLTTGEPSSWHFTTALWPLPTLLCISAASLLAFGFRCRRRATAGNCTSCGYSLAGLATSASCPECGKVASLPN